jgi:L-lactate dehydrogenase (cytochrome)
VLRILPQEAYVGQLDPSTFPRHLEIPTEDEMRIATARALLPPPSAVLNLREIEVRLLACYFPRRNFLSILKIEIHQKLAQSVLSQTAWAYYRSAGDDEHSPSR